MSIDTLHTPQIAEADPTPPHGILRVVSPESVIAPDLQDTVVGIDTAPSFKREQVRIADTNQLRGTERIEEDQVHAEGMERPADQSVQDRTDTVLGNMSDRSAHIRGRRVIADVNGKPFTRKEVDSIRYPKSHDSDDRGVIKQKIGHVLVSLASIFVDRPKPIEPIDKHIKNRY